MSVPMVCHMVIHSNNHKAGAANLQKLTQILWAHIPSINISTINIFYKILWRLEFGISI